MQLPHNLNDAAMQLHNLNTSNCSLHISPRKGLSPRPSAILKVPDGLMQNLPALWQCSKLEC